MHAGMWQPDVAHRVVLVPLARLLARPVVLILLALPAVGTGGGGGGGGGLGGAEGGEELGAVLVQDVTDIRSGEGRKEDQADDADAAALVARAGGGNLSYGGGKGGRRNGLDGGKGRLA